MTLELLIHAIVRQTTLLIAQLATSGGARAPLAQVANQVFLDLVRELERQGVSRKVSADMFGLGLRTYQRKIQRLSESSTDQGRSLWVAVLDFVQAHATASRADVLNRFAGDDEVQVRGVLHDLCESGLVVATGSGASLAYRAASEEELGSGGHRAEDGLEQFLWALIYREGPFSVEALAERTQLDAAELEGWLGRLVDAGRIERDDEAAPVTYHASSLVVPLGSAVGWEAAVFDHFKAMVNTIGGRLRTARTGPKLADRIGGSTYTLDIWPGHPLEDEVYDSLKTLRGKLGDLRERVERFNEARELPENHTKVVMYVGQCPIPQGNGSDDVD
ncbi:MAG: hypothetical protein M3020_15765 [Myxococcota bacterium]|nr:hypothetical protein [Myxococcota bacterium]